MRERRLLSFLFVGPCLLSACALIADLGDRSLGDPKAKPGSDSSSSGSDGRDDPEDDSGTNKPDRTPNLPAYCDGILMYASFDTALTGEVNGSAVTTIGGVTQSGQGKFGGAASLVATAQDDPNGAQLFFLTDGGVSPFPDKVGSIGLWYRPAPGRVARIPVLYRPTANLPPFGPGNLIRTAGLAQYIRFDPPGGGGPGRDLVGLVQVIAGEQEPVLMVDSGATTTFLKPGEFNHYFASWNQASSPTASFALNGGVGTNFGGGAAESYPDGGAPFRTTTSATWGSEGAPVALRLGGSANNSPEGFYDDVVVWNRVVPFDQVAALFNSGKSVGETCNLK